MGRPGSAPPLRLSKANARARPTSVALLRERIAEAQETIPFSRLSQEEHLNCVRDVEMRASLSIIRNTSQTKAKRAAGCLKANASRFLGQLCTVELDSKWITASPNQPRPEEDLHDKLSSGQRALCSKIAVFLQGRDWEVQLVEKSAQNKGVSVLTPQVLERVIQLSAGTKISAADIKAFWDIASLVAEDKGDATQDAVPLFVVITLLQMPTAGDRARRRSASRERGREGVTDDRHTDTQTQTRRRTEAIDRHTPSTTKPWLGYALESCEGGSGGREGGRRPLTRDTLLLSSTSEAWDAFLRRGKGGSLRHVRLTPRSQQRRIACDAWGAPRAQTVSQLNQRSVGRREGERDIHRVHERYVDDNGVVRGAKAHQQSCADNDQRHSALCRRKKKRH